MLFDEFLTLRSELSDRHVHLPECRIFYQQGGLGISNTPILFLHGWGISTAPYHEILERLSRHHTVIAPDLPSFARSPYPQLISTYDQYAELILSFLAALNLRQVHLVGHSLGGGISITLAALAPERVKSVTLVDSTGIPSVSFPEIAIVRAIEMVAQISLPKLKLQLVDIPQVFSHNLLFNTGNVVQALIISLEADLRHLLPHIQAPCQLLWSEKDLTTPLTDAQEMWRLIPNSTLTTVDVGWHEWGLWHPERFAAEVLNFVRQVEG